MDLATFLILILALYVLQAAVLLLGMTRISGDYGAARPSVSVIVAARNEEDAIGNCIDTVCTQSYPVDLFQVIVVDDDSTDRTAEIVRERMRRFPHLRLERPDAASTLRGKSRALEAGISRATGEVVLITDADCRVPPTWVEETARRYTPDVGLIGGMTLQESTTTFGGMQSLDWAYLLGIAASSVALGGSFGSIGNNLSFRKKAYEEVGGYGALPFSVTEDYTLVRAICKTRRWKQLYPIDPRVLVQSQPCADLRTLFRQKHRWGRGGLDVPLAGFLIMAVGWCVHALPFVHTIVWGAWAHTLTILLVKASADYAVLYSVLHRLGRTDDLRHFFAFQLYFTAYVIALPFIVLAAGPVRWKGRSY
ncbi:MAG: glycosyltransferase [Bacteroidota bacterium]